MKNKIIKKILFIVLICLVFSFTNVNAETLKHLKEQLARDEANQAAIVKRKKDVQNKINSSKSEISTLENNIIKYEKETDDLLNDIDNLESDIDKKKDEIDSLLSFLQISNEDNVYLVKCGFSPFSSHNDLRSGYAPPLPD